MNIAKEAIELFGEKSFYTISISEYNVILQGEFDSGIVKRCKEDEFILSFDDNGFVQLTKDNLIIILTQ